MRAQLATLFVDGKMIKQWTGVKNLGDFENPFFHALENLKIELLWDSDAEKELVKLDGTIVEDLPWCDEDFRKSANSFFRDKCLLDI